VRDTVWARERTVPGCGETNSAVRRWCYGKINAESASRIRLVLQKSQGAGGERRATAGFGSWMTPKQWTACQRSEEE
jgi:hypothetical protein